ncbi:hypothetical protein BDN71DRAFT_250343 [Pleurotus eryngii]|uniref:Uncharacterized protein n=1 Tax=Pleurotus eryngii TaxID=5323 RepID=A0A9P5ZP88_PLEER|nr:hypothetical protein BDN71DRAFT_250343 [Pleurotus eryngii]
MENRLFTNFPPEVVWHIFEHAARSSSSTCKALCLVNSWSRQLVLPHLFSTVILPTEAAIKDFRSMIFLQANPNDKMATHVSQKLRLPDFVPSEHVQNLWMEDAYNGVKKVMESCYNAEHVAMDQESFLHLMYVPLVRSYFPAEPSPPERSHPLQLVIIDSDSRWNRASRQGRSQALLSTGITHIRLASPMIRDNDALDIAAFPDLTHFAMPLSSCLAQDPDVVSRLLQNSTLQMLVCVIDGDNERELARAWLRDARRGCTNAFLVESSGLGLREEWEAEVRGGKSVWERAIGYTRKVLKEDAPT